MKIKILSRSNLTADAHVGDVIEVHPDEEIFSALAAGMVGLVDYGDIPSGRAGSGAVHDNDTAPLDEGQDSGSNKGRGKRNSG